MGKINFRNVAKTAAEALSEKKGKDIMLLDVRKMSDSVDYFIIASGTSDVHLRTLIDVVEEKVDIPVYKKEVASRTNWAVLDYGSVMVHVFLEDARIFFNLEKLWNSAKVVKIEGKKAKNVKRNKKRSR